MISFARHTPTYEDVFESSGESLKHILMIIDSIGKTSSKAEKIAIIEKNKDVPYFSEVVYAALDVYKMYHIASVKNESAHTYNQNKNSFKYKERTLANLFAKLTDLAKESGATSLDRIELSYLASADAETRKVLNLILRKNLKCGAGVKTFKNVFAELPIHEVALCYDDLDKFKTYCGNDASHVYVSDKLDGVRTWAFINEDDNVRYLSRNGEDYSNFSSFDEEVRILIAEVAKLAGRDTVTIDGEAISSTRDFDSFCGNARKKTNADVDTFTYNVFDFVDEPLPDFVEENLPLKTRISILEKVMENHTFTKIKMVKHKKLESWDAVSALLDSAISRGEEGLVLKCADDVYMYGRKRTWCKLKKRDTVDLPVVRIQEGEGKYEGVLGALICLYNGKEVKVGSGFTDEQRKLYMENPPRMVEVYFQNTTKKGSLRFPIFVKDRFDKVVDEDFQTE